MLSRSHSVDTSLLVRDAHGRYHQASAEQVFDAARQMVDRQMQRGMAIVSPADVKSYLVAKLAGLDHEVFAALFLDAKFRLIEYVEMFRGTIDGAAVYPREVLKAALRLNAVALIVAHNHPSGSLDPSAADRAITQRLREALALIEVRLLDHVIVGGSATATFAERGLL